MTANGTAGGSMSPMTSLLAVLYKAGRLVRRILLGGLFVLAAGIVAIATAILGVLVAIAALMLRIRMQRNGAQSGPHTTREDGTTQPPSVTLEARQTGEGWTVE